jgi:hypothetical protein
VLIPTRLPQPASEAPTRTRESSSPGPSISARSAQGPASVAGARAAPAAPLDDVSAKLERVITRLAPVASNVGPGPAGGEAVALGEDIGLSLTVAPAVVKDPHQAVGQSATRATEVDPGALFGAVDPAQRPRFEGGQRVVAGSFLLNGKRIEVLGDDSISSVLQRMAENLPALEATFADDRVRLSMRNRLRRPLTVENDTSGFVAASGLGAAVTELDGAMGSARRAERAYGEDGDRDLLLRRRRAR